ncbi:MAG: shikimate dehydrogenase [Catalinimonas sp.]
MRRYGLIGHPLSHSFSPGYFADKFAREGIADASYEPFELPDLAALPDLLRTDDLWGLNVTIPHKEGVKPHLDALDVSAERVGAVNVLARRDAPDGTRRWTGHNTDYWGFRTSLERFLPNGFAGAALILGTGGAARAVRAVLDDLDVPFGEVSRTPERKAHAYEELTPELMRAHRLIVNTTPLGMYPNVDTAPRLPYGALTPEHYLYDLVYNPAETRFMTLGRAAGAQTKNGLEMLHLQAERSWFIWTNA